MLIYISAPSQPIKFHISLEGLVPCPTNYSIMFSLDFCQGVEKGSTTKLVDKEPPEHFQKVLGPCGFAG